VEEITKGQPPLGGRGKSNPDRDKVRALVAAALADKGEWFSIPIPKSYAPNGIRATILGVIATAVSESSSKNGRIWIRFYK
jgi:hypothetical protein